MQLNVSLQLWSAVQRRGCILVLELLYFGCGCRMHRGDHAFGIKLFVAQRLLKCNLLVTTPRIIVLVASYSHAFVLRGGCWPCATVACVVCFIFIPTIRS